MSIFLDADALAPNDRAEAIRTLIWDTVVRVEIEHHADPARISATGTISDVGRINVCSIRSNATTVTRTMKLTHDEDDPYLFLGIQLSGSSMVVQADREAVLRPGDMAVYDTRRPYTLVNDNGIHQHFFRFPIADLELPGKVLEALTGTRFGGDRPLARITAGHLREVADNLSDLNPQEAEDVAEPTFSLIRALLASQIDDLPEARERVERSLEHRILRYVRTHLHENDLSATRIAHEHHISVRQLYRLLNRSGIVLGDWLREQRLEACRRALSDPGDVRTITAVAQQWGFVDMTHFGRAFKNAYGMSPRDWRTASRAGALRSASSVNLMLRRGVHLAQAAEQRSF